MYKCSSTRLTAYLSSETMETRKQWDSISNVGRENKLLTNNSIAGKTNIQK